MKNIFEKSVTKEVIERIHKLSLNTQPQWGTMNVAQMLAHCIVPYETVFTDKYPKPNWLAKFFIKLLAKNQVVSDKPYSKNSRTAPHFLITDERDFKREKALLIAYLIKTQELGATYFEGKESHSFGSLTANEWNNLFYKHLDHHLKQFGV